MTLGQALEAAARRLAQVSDSPRLDAEVLLAHVTGRRRGSLFAYAGDAVPDSALARYEQLLERRAAREPVAYLTGEKEFWSLPLAVGPGVLVPRPETELLVEWALELLPARGRALDLGTGSGAIALALARDRPLAELVAVDLSTDALEQARANAARLGLERVRFLHGDWWAPVDGRFDLVLSNPPYIAADDAHLAALAAEPQMALTDGADGLAHIRRIVQGGPARMNPGAWLLVEHGYDQGPAVRKLMQHAGLEAVQTRRDLGGQERATGGLCARRTTV